VNTTEPVVVPTPQQSWSIRSSRAYPDPDVRQEGLAVLSDGVVSGYFLPQVNAATLSIPSFAQYSDSIGDFSGVVSAFISNTTKQGLNRVIIDLQQNTGGTVELAFSTFKRFFPNVDPFAGSRRRDHYLGGIIGEAYTSYFNSLNPSDPSYDNFLATEWVVTSKLNAATGQNFTSWAEYRGPVLDKGDSFSLTVCCQPGLMQQADLAEARSATIFRNPPSLQLCLKAGCHWVMLPRIPWNTPLHHSQLRILS
jgi:hypothetical protein